MGWHGECIGKGKHHPMRTDKGNKMERIWKDMEPEEYANVDTMLENNMEKRFYIIEPAPSGCELTGDIMLLAAVATAWDLLRVELAHMVYLSIGEAWETRGIKVTRLA